MGLAIGDFDRRARAFVAQLERGAVARARFLAVETRHRIRATCPVKTGRLRASWNATAGAPSGNEPGISAVSGLQFGETAWVASGVFYGPFVEFGTVHMSPRLFITLALNTMGLRPQWTRRRSS